MASRCKRRNDFEQDAPKSKVSLEERERRSSVIRRSVSRSKKGKTKAVKKNSTPNVPQSTSPRSDHRSTSDLNAFQSKVQQPSVTEAEGNPHTSQPFTALTGTSTTSSEIGGTPSCVSNRTARGGTKEPVCSNRSKRPVRQARRRKAAPVSLSPATPAPSPHGAPLFPVLVPPSLLACSPVLQPRMHQNVLESANLSCTTGETLEERRMEDILPSATSSRQHNCPGPSLREHYVQPTQMLASPLNHQGSPILTQHPIINSEYSLNSPIPRQRRHGVVLSPADHSAVLNQLSPYPVMEQAHHQLPRPLHWWMPVGGYVHQQPRPSTMVGPSLQQPHPSTMVGPSLQQPHPSMMEGPSLQQPLPSTMEGSSLQQPHPSMMEGPSLQQPRPSTIEGSSLQQPRPSTIEGSSLQQPHPSTMEGPSLQQPRPSTIEGPSLQQPRPSTIEGPSLQQPRPSTLEGPSLQQPRPSTIEGPSLQQPRPSTIEGPSLQQQPRPSTMEGPSLQQQPRPSTMEGPSLQQQPRPSTIEGPSLQQPRPSFSTATQVINPQNGALHTSTPVFPSPLSTFGIPTLPLGFTSSHQFFPMLSPPQLSVSQSSSTPPPTGQVGRTILPPPTLVSVSRPHDVVVLSDDSEEEIPFVSTSSFRRQRGVAYPHQRRSGGRWEEPHSSTHMPIHGNPGNQSRQISDDERLARRLQMEEYDAMPQYDPDQHPWAPTEYYHPVIRRTARMSASASRGRRQGGSHSETHTDHHVERLENRLQGIRRRVADLERDSYGERQIPRRLLTMFLTMEMGYEHLLELANLMGSQPQGLNKEALDQLKVYKFREEDGETEDRCTICLADYVKGEDMRLLKCKHKYHRECIDNWFKNSFTCPQCRSSMK